jgi:hypothetical protein
MAEESTTPDPGELMGEVAIRLTGARIDAR